MNRKLAHPGNPYSSLEPLISSEMQRNSKEFFQMLCQEAQLFADCCPLHCTGNELGFAHV
uniref:Uncharacterized protein n=1 Tax=Rhizophora mucronata TaxID=61149 RepID=A0A2P2PP74_RHIMU